ncbi:MAG: amino acid synthesis family protein, partial [Actinobacteria bacterium]|nr:amino acid synthesis family protein [Actinomycetota bacterium]
MIANPLAGQVGGELAELEALGAEISGELASRALAA